MPTALLIAGPNGAGRRRSRASTSPLSSTASGSSTPTSSRPGSLRSTPTAQRSGRGGSFSVSWTRPYNKQGESFAVETTLSGSTYTRRIPRWQAAGYRVTLIFLRLSSVDTAIARVAERVQQGGHNTPAPVIRRRFDAGWQNFQQAYKPIVDDWVLFDSSNDVPVILDRSAP